ncbi:MAG: hypothetical protein AB7P49_02025 [Bdellovibrionales bacterium]
MVVLNTNTPWAQTTDDLFWDPGQRAPVRELRTHGGRGRVIVADRLESVLKVQDEYEAVRQKLAARYMPVEAKRYLLDPSYSTSAVKTGDEKFQDLCDAVSQLNRHSVSVHRHPIPNTHLRIIQIITSTLLEKIYGNEYETRKPYLLRLFGVSFFRSCTMVSMFRRSGKSELVAMLMAAYASSQICSKACIYSVGKRASALLASKIVTHILTLMGKDLVFKTRNEERIVFTSRAGGPAEISSYPANEEVSSLFFLSVYVYQVAGSK